jgi:hypothetical protein
VRGMVATMPLVPTVVNAVRPGLPPVELRMDAGLQRFWRLVPQAPGSALAS